MGAYEFALLWAAICTAVGVTILIDQVMKIKRILEGKSNDAT